MRCQKAPAIKSDFPFCKKEELLPGQQFLFLLLSGCFIFILKPEEWAVAILLFQKAGIVILIQRGGTKVLLAFRVIVVKLA